MCRVAIASALLAVSVVQPSISCSQETPGQINDPSTYRGSMANQEQERQAYQ